jgi:hypothetical protein
VSATVTGSKAPTGSVQFYETGNSRALTPGVALVGGTAQSTVTLQAVGVHQIYATYSGDVSNISSKSANVGAVITGSGTVAVLGTTTNLNHALPVFVTFQ